MAVPLIEVPVPMTLFEKTHDRTGGHLQLTGKPAFEQTDHSDGNAQRPVDDQSVLRPFIIPLFIPHCGCPHRCVFCNQQAITGAEQRLPTPGMLRRRVRTFLEYRGTGRSVAQIAFFGGNFLGLMADEVRAMLEVAESFVQNRVVDGIRFSTRPDTITAQRLSWLQGYSVRTIELGVQSMDNRVLSRIHRGHRAADTVKAVRRLRSCKVDIGLQLMVGLPGENRCSTIHTARAVLGLRPDFVRIYPTLVLKNSPLALWYQQGRYRPLTLEQAVDRTKHLYRLFRRHHIPVIRMGLQASKELDSDRDVLAGPHHPAFGHLVHSAVFFDRAVEVLANTSFDSGRVIMRVHPASASKLRGLRNTNIVRLKKRFQIGKLRVCPDDSLKPDEVRIGGEV